jgi:hypothetical protein
MPHGLLVAMGDRGVVQGTGDVFTGASLADLRPEAAAWPETAEPSDSAHSHS